LLVRDFGSGRARNQEEQPQLLELEQA
jgi:hypothetical protein